MKLYTAIIGLLLLGLPIVSSAHPGNTASDGCHYCRTNCSKWGVEWDERHCHGGNTAPTPSYSNVPAPTSCPANSRSDGSGGCTCNAGYSPYGSTCVKIPANGHAVTNGSDAWECNTGYVESGSSCVASTPTPTPTKTVSAVKSSATSSNTPRTVSPEQMNATTQTTAASTSNTTEEESSGNPVIGAAIVGGGYWYWRKRKKGKVKPVA